MTYNWQVFEYSAGCLGVLSFLELFFDVGSKLIMYKILSSRVGSHVLLHVVNDTLEKDNFLSMLLVEVSDFLFIFENLRLRHPEI